MMKKFCVGLTLLVGGLLMALPAPALATPAAAATRGASAAPARRHPQMEAALAALTSARRQLNHAATVYGGHRVNAIKATDRAIHEIRAALNYAATGRVGRIPPAPPIMGGNRKASRGHPAIHRAIDDLTTANAHLQRGASVFGGHRVAAIKSVNQALSECRAALRYVHSR